MSKELCQVPTGHFEVRLRTDTSTMHSIAGEYARNADKTGQHSGAWKFRRGKKWSLTSRLKGSVRKKKPLLSHSQEWVER